MGDLADRRREAVADDDEIVIGVERQLVRIVRPLGQRGRTEKLFGKSAGYVVDGRACRTQQDAGGKAGEKSAPAYLQPAGLW